MGFRRRLGQDQPTASCCRTYATVADAIASARETVAYVPCIRVTTASATKPDYLATIDLNPDSNILWENRFIAWKCQMLAMNFITWLEFV